MQTIEVTRLELKGHLARLAAQGRFMTLEWLRVTDSVPSLVTVNGIGARHLRHNEYLWQTKQGNTCLLLRGKVVPSRTWERHDGNQRANTSDAGAEGDWHYWTVRLDAIMRLLADGVILKVVS